jgi:fermentation-respiration switch protein FrsA (DUF1100 family)
LKNPIIKNIYRSVIAIVAIYLLLITGLFFFQDKIIFHPEKLSEDYHFNFDQPFQEITITSKHGNRLNGVVFGANVTPPKGTILYFHGNADNIQRWGEYAIDFTSLGYTVVMFDYAGFGKSTGKPSEKVLYLDSEDTREWTKLNFPSINFIIYGRSLGTAVALQLASNHQPKQLLLETPFYELKQDRFKFFIPFGLKYRFPNYEFIQKINCPITIFQGTNDPIVPFKEALKLKPLLKPVDRFIVIDKGGHKNLRDYKLYHDALSETLK